MSRRSALQLAAVSALGVATWSTPASATAPPSRRSATIEDLGPGNVAYPLMSGLLVGDTFFVGSRNLDPTRALGYHVPTRKVTRKQTFGGGNFVQGLAHHNGEVLYAGIVGQRAGEPCIWKWDLKTDQVSSLPVIDGLEVRTLATAPDGTLYAVGKEASSGPGIHEIDPATGAHKVLAVPDPKATQARALAVTETQVVFGAGSNLSGGGDASKATVFLTDRATGESRQILTGEPALDPATRDLAVIGERIYVGTEGSEDKGWFAVYSLANGTLEFQVRSRSKSVKSFIEAGGKIYFDADGLCSYDPATKEYTELPNTGDVGGWGLGHLDGTIVAANSELEAVVHYSIADATSEPVGLAEAGAPVGAQLGMSLAAGHDRIYVGGNGSVVLHKSGTTTRLGIPAEAKDTEIIGNTLYAGVYNSQGIWSYKPGGEAKRIIALPQEQNRPQDVIWNQRLSRLLVGIQCDTKGGGSLAVCDLSANTAKLTIDPLPDLQFPRSVATEGTFAYLGGDNPVSTRAKGHLACVDATTSTVVWTLDPGFNQGVSGLVALNGKLVGLTGKGKLFVVDLATRQVIHTADLGANGGGNSRLIVSRGQIYGGGAAAVFHIDPGTYAVTWLVTGLDGQWYSGPRIAADELGRLYSFKSRNLIRITLS
ncbi:hypothetical protein ABZ297_37975 [Nonomuraea sp. NPDC005983]|uniref:hypothetical protein n=1 Tax=Nonomuraea sp. NPDC005983 TaxID=3155595 RepID=UPI0033BDE3E5